MKDLKHYLALPYTVVIRRDEEGYFVARVDELPGCAAHGETPASALENLEEAKALWISDCLEKGDPVPEPQTEESLPSGKWVQRVPRTLHRKLIAVAKREKVSLNQLVTSILAEALGARNVRLLEGSFAQRPAAMVGHWERFAEEDLPGAEWIFLSSGAAPSPWARKLMGLLNPRGSATTKLKRLEDAFEEETAHFAGR